MTSAWRTIGSILILKRSAEAGKRPVCPNVHDELQKSVNKQK
jgi:hypothetical protein